MRLLLIPLLVLGLAASAAAQTSDDRKDSVQAPRSDTKDTPVPQAPRTAPPLPWSKHSVAAKDVEGVGQGGCRNGHAIVLAKLTHGGDAFLFFVDPETNRFIFVKLTTEGTPEFIYVGEGSDDEIAIKDAHAFSPAKDGQGPCDLLNPTTT